MGTLWGVVEVDHREREVSDWEHVGSREDAEKAAVRLADQYGPGFKANVREGTPEELAEYERFKEEGVALYLDATNTGTSGDAVLYEEWLERHSD